ncbi:MAG: hypothetical protein ACE5IB_07905 [Candidatus Geothermarchaeales archaeon]
MLDWLRKALTRTEIRRVRRRGKKVEKAVVPPNEGLVYGVGLSILFFVTFSVLQVIHILVFQEWNDTIFNAMTFISGSLISAFFVNGMNK